MVVDPFRQVRLGIYVVAISLSFVVVASILFYAAARKQYEHVMSIFQIVGPADQWELIANQVVIDNTKNIGILFIVFLVVLIAVVFQMTHRIYGPLVSIERFVDDIADGRYSRRIAIRKRDDLQRLANKLNGMAMSLQRRHGADHPAEAPRTPENLAS